MLFRSYRKRTALERYRSVLGPRLRGLYGRKETYSPEQVLSTIRIFQLGDAFACYALAMYCDQESFDAYHKLRADVVCSYDRLSRELAQGANGAYADTSMRLGAVEPL